MPRSMPRWAKTRPDARSAPSDGADDLRADVGRDLAPGEALGRRERERDGRVDVTARDLADRVDERGDDEAERERDAEQIGPVIAAGCRPRAERRDDRPRTDQDEQRGAERLGERALGQRVLLHGVLLED